MAGAARRIGGETSATRAAILAATEQMIREEGYAAVSTRKVAAKAGLKPSLVHYYFPTTDDLFLAVHRQGAAESDAMIDAALNSDDPVRALWAFFADSSRTTMSLEYMALANHRKTIRSEMVAHSEKMRERQAEALSAAIGKQLAGSDGCSPAGLSVILAGIGRALVMEGGLGVSAGHEDARIFVEQWLDRLLAESSPK